MGLSETGYRRRTYEEILTAKIEKAKELFGEEINTSGNTPLGKYIRINAYDQYTVEELAEKVYYSIFPQTASGQSLDRLGWSVGITRDLATPAQYSVRVTGTAGATIDIGFLVGTETELNFYTTTETTIGEDGTCEIAVECVEVGTVGNVEPSEIDRVVNPDAEIDSIIGVSVLQAGTDDESDYEFLKRFEMVREGRGGCTAPSIISALVDIPTVNGAYIVVNESATETENDIPPKTIAVYVDGGQNYHQEIAEAIFDKKPIGVGTYGDQTVLLSYGALTDYPVQFSHAAPVTVYVSLTIGKNSEFEEDGTTAIKENVQGYINSLGIGNGLVTTALYSHIYSVAGVTSATVQVSTDGETYSGDNIEVDPYECCIFKSIIINGVAV